MSAPLITVDTSSSVQAAADVMWLEKIGALAIVDPSGNLAGIVSERDMLFAATKGLFQKSSNISEIMRTNVVTIGAEDEAAEAIQMMRTHNIKHLVVLGSDNKPVGMVSMRDVLDLAALLLSVLQPPD